MHQRRGIERRRRRPKMGVLSCTTLLCGYILLTFRVGGFGTAARAEGPPAPPVLASPELRLSVYATASDVLRYLQPEAERARTLERLRSLSVTRVFLEGRRGDEYVPPQTLSRVRAALEQQGIRCAGGIATVPGTAFGARQNEALGWLDWENPKTREGVASFFRENAPVFDELIVDDFYCTGDTSPTADRARGSRDWGAYRRDLLVDSMEPLLFEPTRSARSTTRLIIKFPQWYDRFHRFGYDPARMSPPFDQVWVGTEVRNPLTRRMGFVQPTEGFINFSWIRSIAGPKTVGAWFDHIECTAQNFLDQAYLSVLAGARELTLFRLADVMENHPGDTLLAQHWPALRSLAENVRKHRRTGIAFYKPPDSDPADNLYLMDYLAYLGLPILPSAPFPEDARVLVLGAQAAADPAIADRAEEALNRGRTVVVTPAFLRAANPRLQALAGVRVGATVVETNLLELRIGRKVQTLSRPVELDGSVQLGTARPRITGGSDIPILAEARPRRGRLVLLNLRTFSEQNFRDVGEWLLAPRELGWSVLPENVANAIRDALLTDTRLHFEAPAGVAFVPFDRAACLYNFRPEPVSVRVGRKRLQLAAHECRWLSH